MDVSVFISRHRITYTPEGGREILLLDVGDCVDAEPAFSGGPQMATTPLIARQWALHHSTGNAAVTLSLDCHLPAASMAAAQAMGLERWRLMTTQPNGTLRFQTAFPHGGKSCPLVDWTMRATVSTVSYTEENGATAPFDTAACCHLGYELAVSLPETPTPAADHGQG